MEEWERIADFPGYEVSNTGLVRSTVTGRLIAGHILKNGYRQVCLSIDKKPVYRVVHRLVMAAFWGEIPDGMEVNHKDGVKLNNHIDNLEYVTHRDNMTHSLYSLNNPGRKLTSQDADDIRRRRANRERLIDVANLYQITPAMVRRIAKNLAWKNDLVVITDGRKKLTEEKVVRIRERLSNGETHVSIASDFGVSADAVDDISNGNTWKLMVKPSEG